MCSRPEFHALFESSTAADQDPAVFALSGVDRGGREFTLPRGPAFDVGARGIYRPIIPPPSPTMNHVLYLDGFRSAFGAETRFVDGFKVETIPPRNLVSSAAHRDMKRRDMALFYDFSQWTAGFLQDSRPHSKKSSGFRAFGAAVTTPHDVFWPPTILVTPPQAACVSCASPAAVRCHPKRRDTCTTSRQPHRLSFQIEENKIESPRCQTAPICLGEPQSFFKGLMIVVCDLSRGLFKLDLDSGPISLATSPASKLLFPASGTPSGLAHRIRSPREFGPREHHRPPCIVVYARPRRTAARQSAPTLPCSGSEFVDSRHHAPLTPEIEIPPFQSEVRHTNPNQMERAPSPGIPRSPRPVRRPSADPVLAQPTIFASSSDVAVFLSARRDEASANDTPGSQIAQPVTPKITVT
ncbi:hypothetical protein THAOC_04452 [Thalassiosira oceanica]|uniref:Uncharacterized protein n=1 Tax=Thalassiosira oceanica TaxID=159749 RepID=K0T8J6_THAOC|nr:hypothetical protein THAOC_04452 [Thalassiosira oceanica]|eukprot:EJK73905.1 hypothetical protein THAOC_04452 [Thalassiosira oceanica]